MTQPTFLLRVGLRLAWSRSLPIAVTLLVCCGIAAAQSTITITAAQGSAVVKAGASLRLGNQGLLTLDAREFRIKGDRLQLPSARNWRRFRSPEMDVSTVVRQVAPGVLHVEWKLGFNGPVELREIAARFRFLPSRPNTWETARRDFHWVPNIKAAPDQIAADHVFRSPVVMIMAQDAGVALIPDLDVLRANRPAPHFLDLQFPRGEAPFIEYGLTPSRPEGHVYYRRTNQTFTPDKQQVRFACYVLLRPKTTREQLTNDAVQFLWSRYAAAYTATVKPQVTPYATYAQYGYRMALDQLWVKGPTADTGGITLSTYRNKETGRYGGRTFENDLWFHSWFNNLRTAWGLHYWGEKLRRPDWVERSRAMARLILAAPREQGLFATIYKSHDRTWQSSGQGGGPNVYHLPDNAWTAIWLLRFHQEREAIAEAPALLTEFMRSLLRLQHPDGSFPTRVFTGSLATDPVLDKSASGALPIWFLAEMLHRKMVAPALQQQVRDAIRRGADDLSTRLVPAQRFEDFELYFSCSKKPLTFYDEVTEMSGQNTLAMQWSAEALLLAHKLLGNPAYLRAGKFSADLLSLYQQVWNPPYLTLYAFGGFGVMNTDAEWNDARQAQFAETFANYYEATRDPMYFERAVAAARASFTLVVMDENKEMAPRNYRGVEKNSETHGASAENYGHRGEDVRAFMSGFHWGTGSALTTAAVLKDRYSDLYLNEKLRHAFGIDGLTVKRARWNARTVALDVESTPGASPVQGKVDGAAKSFSVTTGRSSAPVTGDGTFELLLNP